MPIVQKSNRPSSHWPHWHENTPFALAVMLVLAFLAVFLMVKTAHTLKLTEQVGKPEPFEHQITVDGLGKVTGTPDIATVSMGIDTKGADVATAQAANSEAMNTLINRIIALGVAEEDVQTANYSVYENQVYNPETEQYEAKGWVVSQQLSVKVRDTQKISSVLDTAGRNGATNIYGPNFTIDDPSKLKDEAREEAIADATAKAAALAKTLGVRLERVVGYSEWTDTGYPYPMYDRAEGIGGGAPNIEPGTSEVTLNVSITYKLAE